MGIKILLADDSVTAQNMGKKILSEAGHSVVTVSNGAAAAKKIAELKPEVVLLDVFMPGYTGIELCEKLRNSAETSRLPVLLTVGKLEPYSPQEAARVKADGVIIKPFEAGDLTAAVERLAQKAKPGKAATSAKQEAPAQTEESDPSAAAHTSVPKDYEQTVRLDSEQIAAMLKVAGKPETPAESAAQETISSGTPAYSLEEFSVNPGMGSERGSPNADLPAFGEEVAGVAPAEVPSYMAQYLDEPRAESSAPDFSVTAPMVPPPAEIPDPKEQEAADLASTTVLPKDSVQHFDTNSAPELPVNAAEGLELTAAAPVGDIEIEKDAALEPTIHASETPVIIAPDPALVSDPHRSTMDFVTQFGTGEPGLAEQLLESMNSSAGEKAVDDFEARLNAAMSAFNEPSGESIFSATETEPSSPAPELSGSELSSELSPSGSAFELPMEAPNAAPPEFSPKPQLSTEASRAWNEAELEREHTASISFESSSAHAIPEIEPTAGVSEGASEIHAEDVNAVSSSFTPTPPKSNVVPIEAPAPETDDAVIQQMRDAFSGLPVDHSHLLEQTEAEPEPMAMAASASAAPATAPPAQLGHEAELEIARALSAAVGGESTLSVSSRLSEASTSSGDANHIATAVENVMKRELPNLIWKIMAELDLRKRS